MLVFILKKVWLLAPFIINFPCSMSTVKHLKIKICLHSRETKPTKICCRKYNNLNFFLLKYSEIDYHLSRNLWWISSSKVTKCHCKCMLNHTTWASTLHYVNSISSAFNDSFCSSLGAWTAFSQWLLIPFSQNSCKCRCSAKPAIWIDLGEDSYLL